MDILGFRIYKNSERNPFENRVPDSEADGAPVAPATEPEAAQDGAPFQEVTAPEIAPPIIPENASTETISEDSVPTLEPSPDKRLGIHYFADDQHYNQADLDQWLPVLQTLGINWITLPAPLDRAIPHGFLDALVSVDIQPVVQLNIPLTDDYILDDFSAMLRSYANSGVRYVVLFDRPNLRDQWPGIAWTQRGLVDRFLDKFLPLAKAAVEAGLSPVFPALEPGGDYWDTAFLRAALESLNNRGEGQLLDSLALGAYVWTEDRSMTWGAGGPESWPATMPYHTPQGSEDQRGFRIFDWYNAISEAALGKQLPIIIVAAGVQRESGKALDARVGTRAIKMAQTLARPADPDKNNAVPANVLACNFWLLSAASGSSIYELAWFKSQNGKPTKAGEEWLNWHIGATGTKTIFDQVGTTAPPIGACSQNRAISESLPLATR